MNIVHQIILKINKLKNRGLLDFGALRDLSPY
jgi:hypothetical protein